MIFGKRQNQLPVVLSRNPLHRITLRLSEKELAKLNHLSNGMSRSAYIRKVLFGKDVYHQLTDRQTLQNEVLFLHHSHNITIKSLNRDIAKYLKLSPAKQKKALIRKTERKRRNKRQRSQKLD